jgi:hypothetical protein
VTRRYFPCIVHNVTMNKRPTKRELRAELDRHVREFVSGGGEIKQVNMGESGLVDGQYNPRRFGFESAPQQRTPVASLLATIDARRKEKKPAAAAVRKQPRQKVIYDDFGEPLRRVWSSD